MKAPNIFDYATSELSQDAFLCWLIACADCDDAALKNLGLSFIRFLYDPNNTDKHEIKVQGLVKTKEQDDPYPWQQYGKTDVYFQATVNDKKVSFVIEDKTDTAMHDDQLKRYATFVEGDEIEEDEVRLIYFKSGYVYPDEKADANKEGFVVINLEDCIKFLANHENIDNDVFKSYLAHVKKIKKDREEILKEANDFCGDSDSYSRIFGHLYAQHYLMTMLKEKIMNMLEPDSDKRIWRGKEIGGPWTQLDFYKIPRKDQGDEEYEHLYWRLDESYQLRLRHGSGFDQDRRERLVMLREIFEEVGKPIFNEAFRPPTGRTGRNSSVGEIQFNPPDNSVQKILARMPEFCEKFIKRVREEL